MGSLGRLPEDSAGALVRNLRTSPRKLDLICGLIRGEKVDNALSALQFCPRRLSVAVHRALRSAVANAENNHQLDVDRLRVIEASVGRSMIMRRFRARAKGRGASIRKLRSHLRLVVREEKTADLSAKGRNDAGKVDSKKVRTNKQPEKPKQPEKQREKQPEKEREKPKQPEKPKQKRQGKFWQMRKQPYKQEKQQPEKQRKEKV